MIKHEKLPENIIPLVPEAAVYLNSIPEIDFAYLFGGLVKTELRPLSDVDIAVYIEQEADITNIRFDILGGLNYILKTDEIDLVVLNNAPLPLAMRILSNKKLLVDKKPYVRHAYESLIMREYFDFSFLEKSILKRRFQNG